MNRPVKLSVFLILTFLISACTTTDGSGRYRIASIGNAQRSVEAIVLAAEPVLIQTSISGSGGTAGGLLGAAATAESSDNSVVIIAGIIGGAIIGNALESAANTHDAMEYVIETETGILLTVAQVNSGSVIFTSGDKVILVYGYPNRLIKDPR